MTSTEFRTARKQLGLTQAELAAVMGYHAQPAISDIENGGTVPAQAARLILAYMRGDRPDDWPEKH